LVPRVEVRTREPFQEDILTSLKTLTDAASELGKDAIESLDDAREETAGVPYRSEG